MSGFSAFGNATGDSVGLFGGAYGSVNSAQVGAWLAQLQPASWRGLPFGVNSSEYSRGRRTALHEYPFRDSIWVEDLGRAVRSVAFSGFVVGDDCYAQAQALLAAAETAGPGELIHPSLGSLTVALVANMRATERKELGRVVEISFEFAETGLSIYPATSVSTGTASSDAATTADSASSSDFFAGAGAPLAGGPQVVAGGVATARSWASVVQGLAGDASLVTGAVAGLPGNIGRYATGARGTLLAGVTTAEGAIAAVANARVAIASAASNVATLSGTL